MTPEPFSPRCIEVRNAGATTGDGNNTYLVGGHGSEAGLVDAGTGDADHLDRLSDALAAGRLRLTDVLVTHAHADHASGAPALARRFGVTRFHKHRSPEDTAGIDWRHVPDGARLDVGGVVLEALHTPGHAPDHLVLWHEASRSAFTGDLVHRQSSMAIIESRGGDLAQYLASLARLIALAPRRLWPGHGPVIDEPDAVLRGTLAHRLRREQEVLDAVRSGADAVHAIADCIYDGLGPPLMALACENVRAHLTKLERDGRVSREGGGWRPV